MPPRSTCSKYAGTERWHLALYSVTAKRAQKRNGAYDEVMLALPDEVQRPAESATAKPLAGDEITGFRMLVVTTTSVEGLDGLYLSFRYFFCILFETPCRLKSPARTCRSWAPHSSEMALANVSRIACLFVDVPRLLGFAV